MLENSLLDFPNVAMVSNMLLVNHIWIKLVLKSWTAGSEPKRPQKQKFISKYGPLTFSKLSKRFADHRIGQLYSLIYRTMPWGKITVHFLAFMKKVVFKQVSPYRSVPEFNWHLSAKSWRCWRYHSFESSFFLSVITLSFCSIHF